MPETKKHLSNAARRAEQAAKGLPALASEMQDYADDRSEQWQDSDKSQAFQEALELVEAARDAAQEIP